MNVCKWGDRDNVSECVCACKRETERSRETEREKCCMKKNEK